MYDTRIYTNALENGFRVSFLQKPSKTDWSDPRSFRPISLCCHLWKLLERIIQFHLKDEGALVKPMHEHQYAFQKGKSTDSAISRTITELERGTLQNDYVIAVFMDIKGAFDNLSYDAQIKAMEKHNVPQIIVKWHCNFLNNRYTKCAIGIQDVTAQLRTGTGQGGVGSPTWFNYGLDELLEDLKKSAANEVGFADDLEFAVKGHTKWSCKKGAQEAIDIAVRWAERNGLEFSPPKTQAMFLTRKIGKNAKAPGPLKMYGQELKHVDSADYLGITINSNLTWSAHLNNKIAKTKRCMIMCRNALAKFMDQNNLFTVAMFGVRQLKPKPTEKNFESLKEWDSR